MRTALEVIANGVFGLWLIGLLPAAAVTVLKGRLAMFLAGWLTLGATWFIGALGRAEPQTWWAQRFYGEERMARAEDPIRHRAPARVIALWLAGAGALILVVGAFAARPTPVTDFDGRDLQQSVGSTNPSLGTNSCKRAGDEEWLCYAYDEEASWQIYYRVQMRGDLGCWRGAPASPAAGGPSEEISGCITIWDQLDALDVL